MGTNIGKAFPVEGTQAEMYHQEHQEDYELLDTLKVLCCSWHIPASVVVRIRGPHSAKRLLVGVVDSKGMDGVSNNSIHKVKVADFKRAIGEL